MAYLDMEDDEQQRAASLGSGGAAAPMPTGGAPAAKAGTGFVNFGSLLGLNSAGGQAMGSAVAGDLQGRADAVRRDAPNAGDAIRERASDVEARANVLGQSGPGQALADLYGGSRPYSSGERAMDSALTGATSGGALRSAAGRLGNFSSLLGAPVEPRQPSGNNGTGPAVGPGGGGLLGGGMGSDGTATDDRMDPRELMEERRRLRQPRESVALAKDPRANPFGPEDDMRRPFLRLLGGG